MQFCRINFVLKCCSSCSTICSYNFPGDERIQSRRAYGNIPDSLFICCSSGWIHTYKTWQKKSCDRWYYYDDSFYDIFCSSWWLDKSRQILLGKFLSSSCLRSCWRSGWCSYSSNYSFRIPRKLSKIFRLPRDDRRWRHLFWSSYGSNNCSMVLLCYNLLLFRCVYFLFWLGIDALRSI